MRNRLIMDKIQKRIVGAVAAEEELRMRLYSQKRLVIRPWRNGQLNSEET